MKTKVYSFQKTDTDDKLKDLRENKTRKFTIRVYWKLQIGSFAEASNFGISNVYAKTPKLYILEAWLTHDPDRC